MVGRGEKEEREKPRDTGEEVFVAALFFSCEWAFARSPMVGAAPHVAGLRPLWQQCVPSAAVAQDRAGHPVMASRRAAWLAASPTAPLSGAVRGRDGTVLVSPALACAPKYGQSWPMSDAEVFLPLYCGMALRYGSHFPEWLGEQPGPSAGPGTFRLTPELAAKGSGEAKIPLRGRARRSPYPSHRAR
jgi:hypothetical protein